MSRIDFGRCFFENVEELLLSVFLHAWARSYICSSILVYAGMFLRFRVRGNGPAYAGSCLRTWALTCIHETLGRSSTLLIFTHFSIVSLPHAILIHLLDIFTSEYDYILLFIFILVLKHHIF